MLRRPFARFALAFVIALVAMPAFALDNRAAATCDAPTAEPMACDTPATTNPAAPHPGSAPARSKYVHTVTAGTASGGGSDGEDSGVVHGNARSSKWHSYLPGMFR